MEGVLTAEARASVRPPGPGLSGAEVAARREAGQINTRPPRTSRTTAEIVRANVFTRFNAILGSLLAVILVVGPIQDALFGLVLVSNAAIGIVQELRAKWTLDRLAILSAPRVRAVRDDRTIDMHPEDVVLDDLLEGAPGDQIVVDGVVVAAAGVEVDESLLSGESEPVSKSPGAKLLSGSFVVAGTVWYRATGVGPDSYARQLADEARRFTLVRSELRSGIDRILRIVTWLIVPAAVLLVSSQLVENKDLPDAIRGSVAGVGSMIPEGLVLLTSVAFAVGIVRLGRSRVLVQELAAIEGLARVDVVCLDKTGTITEPELQLAEVRPLADEPVEAALGALAAVDPHPNASMRALAAAMPAPPWQVTDVVPFASSRRWSGASFGPAGTWLLGAPDAVLGEGQRAALAEILGEELAAGRRVLLLVRAVGGLRGDGLPHAVVPMAVVSFHERIRPDAAETLRYFATQGVSVKVLSGDDPRTVAAVARRVGLPGADAPTDARALPADGPALADALEATTVLGRVAPHHKRAIVTALQSRGHVVAMTGDGVNDVLALKEADIGVAMGSGSSASHAVAPVVLLDSAFSALPAVVAEGRRVIANVERVANLFVTKTVYALALALAVGVAQVPFPFYPRHLTIVSSLTIGIPAFFLALAPNPARARPGFVNRVLRFAIPAGAVAAGATFAAYALARHQPGVSLGEARTTATLVLFGVAIWVLAILARPLTLPRGALVALMAGGFLLVGSLPPLRGFFALDFPALVVVLAGVGIVALADAALEAGWRAAGWAHREQGRLLVRPLRRGPRLRPGPRP